MLVVYKNHLGGIVLKVGNTTLKLSGYGLVDNVDKDLYEQAKKQYSFISEWEKNGLIEVNQNTKKDEESFKAEADKQDEAIAKNEIKSGVRVTRNKKA